MPLSYLVTNEVLAATRAGRLATNKVAGAAALARVSRIIGFTKLRTKLSGTWPDFARKNRNGTYQIDEVKYVKRLGGSRVLQQLNAYIKIADVGNGGRVAVWVPQGLDLTDDVSPRIQEFSQGNLIQVERIPNA